MPRGRPQTSRPLAASSATSPRRAPPLSIAAASSSPLPPGCPPPSPATGTRSEASDQLDPGNPLSLEGAVVLRVHRSRPLVASNIEAVSSIGASGRG